LEEAVVDNPNLPMNHGSLFSGIGGFDLAAEWMGWSNVFNCEWEEFPRRVLKHHFPHATQHKDIREFDATAYAGRVDIVSGGFPCQPYSTAGKRLGKDDERHLWPEMLRVVRECAPSYVVGENVRGLVGWNGGLVFEEVCVDLEALGYAVQPFVLPACGVGAPHRRDRVWFVAWHADGSLESKRPKNAPRSNAKPNGVCNAPDSYDRRTRHPVQPRRNKLEGGSWDRFPTVSPVCGGDDGLPKELDGITFPKWRRESIKAYGNAIVPQVALQIFKAIQAHKYGT
jgi:DNA (cytosine-5)-methyltransferase 1